MNNENANGGVVELSAEELEMATGGAVEAVTLSNVQKYISNQKVAAAHLVMMLYPGASTT